MVAGRNLALAAPLLLLCFFVGSPAAYGQDTLLYFSWNTSVTVPDVAPAGVVASTPSSSANVRSGGVNGTNGLSAGVENDTIKHNIDLTVPGHAAFDVGGLDISIVSQRHEDVGVLVTRGGGFTLGRVSAAYVKYTVTDGTNRTVVESGPSTIPYGAPHHQRFLYDPLSGNAELLLDGSLVWTNPTKTPGQELYWEPGAAIIIGEEVDGFGNDQVVMDELLLRTIPPAAASVLPVDLQWFTAEATDAGVEVAWETNRETNAARYVIARAGDSGAWKEVLTVAGSGDAQDSRSYTVTDYAPLPGTSYYRLQQVDYDGTVSYLGTRTVRTLVPQATVQVSPNPAVAQVRISGVPAGTRGVQVYDTYGRAVGIAVPERLSATTYRVDISGLRPGVYLLAYAGGARRVVKR